VCIQILQETVLFATIDVMIYCQEYGIVTGCKHIVEVVRLSNQAIIKQIKISRYRHETFKHKIIHILPLYDLL
jgi:hypothetical protein